MNWISNPTKRKISWSLIVILVVQCFWPLQSYALTGGPSQPEVESFTPIGTSEMVDVSTGDFSYNIPLLDVGGYPINIAYNAGITTDQEASMVGLGWNINVGSVTRNVRGLPDDFNGVDKVTKKFYMTPNRTWGGNFGLSMELLGFKAGKVKLKGKLGLFKNNLTGWGLEFGVTPSLSAGSKGTGYLNVGLGLSANSQTGIGISPQVNYGYQIYSEENNTANIGLSIGAPFNSRQGLKALSLGPTLGVTCTSDYTYKNSDGEEQTKDITMSHSLLSPSATYSFSNPTYTPSFQFPMINKSISYLATVGLEGFGAFGGASISGYYSEQKLMVNEQTVPAFGTLYSHLGADQDGLMDFNREKDGAFTIDVPNLPLTVRTTDLYNVSGQGVGGSYQLKRGDVGIVYDKSVVSFSAGSSLGAEAGPGNTVRLGGDAHFNLTFAQSGQWSDPQTTFTRLAFQKPEISKPSYEVPYFKRAGELVPVDKDETLFNLIGKYEPVRVLLNSAPSSGLTVNTMPLLVGGANKFVTTVGSVLKRQTREKRTQSISYLTAVEAAHFGLEKEILNYPFSSNNPTTIPRTNYPSHHISEITALRPDGLTYKYGIPIYNKSKEELTFAIDNQGDCTTGLVYYTPTGSNKDDAPENGNGQNEYYNEEQTPEYAHSYLLTTILSEDYVDITNNGPTPDDYGSYTKFNYSQIYGGNNLYQWRVPYGQNQANFNEGLKSDLKDNKANFLYGTKELWMIHSIESKTQITYFYYSDRHDSYGVNGKAGGMGQNQKLKKLNKIELFSLPDLKYNYPTQNDIPIKSVHFEYDYSLCPYVPNNDGQYEWKNIGNNIKIDLNSNKGKLTLKKVYFKYGKSNKGQLSPYKFSYTGPNPSYHLKGYNRWGTYQPPIVKCNPTNPNCSPSASQCNPLSQDLITTEFPYVPQDDRQRQDLCAAAWNLTQIVTPSCAIIKVNYEADDYRYVQDKEAMQMFPIVGAAAFENLPFNPNLNISNLSTSGPVIINNNVIFFKLQEPLFGGLNPLQAKSKIRDAYIRDLAASGYVYFKALVDLTGKSNYDYVPGYAEIEDYGASKGKAGNSTYDYGFIKLKPVCLKDRENNNCNDFAQPISKAAWQYVRLNLPKLAYGSSNTNGGDTESIIKAMANVFSDIRKFIGGFNKILRKDGYGVKLVNNKSFIRLYCPSKKKIAGSHRVKKITLNDTWQMMTGAPNQNFEYGQQYEYDELKKIAGEEKMVSTGVAAYEPILGGDENPLRQPIPYKKELLLAPDNNHYQETPLGESFMPAPTIIYRKVKVSNLSHPNVQKTGIGHTIHQFYTAKDFPVKITTTGVDPKPKKTKPILKILKIKNEDYMTASQGYAIELNDMHGKPRSQYAYDAFGTKISGVKYRYKTKGNGKLDNEVDVILPDSTFSKKHLMGVEYDMIADARESSSNTFSGGLNINNDNFVIPPAIPVFSVVLLPSFSQEKTRFRSIGLTKVIRRYGILERTIAFDQGSSIETKNIAFDYETGEPLLTRTENEFENKIFQLKIPAHWAYEGMQGAYQNIGAAFKLDKKSLGNYKVDDITYFTKGDELIVVKNVIPLQAEKGWVLDINPINEEIKIIDEDGDLFSGTYEGAYVLRSGHQNKQATPIGTLTSLKEPTSIIAGKKVLDLTGNKEILDASAVEFSENWQTHCEEGTNCVCNNNTQLESAFANLLSQMGDAKYYIEDFYNPNSNVLSHGFELFNTISSPVNLSNHTNPVIKNSGGTLKNYFLSQSNLSACLGNSDLYYWSNFNSVNSDLTGYFGNPNGTPNCYCSFTIDFPKSIGLTPNNVMDIEINPKYAFQPDNCNPTTFYSSNSSVNIVKKPPPTDLVPDGIINGATTYDFDLRIFNFNKPLALKIQSNCLGIFTCNFASNSITSCQPQAGDIVNPYRLNIKGVHRPKKNWSYLTDRMQKTYLASNATTSTNIETDGYFQDFSSFWQPKDTLPNPIWVPNNNGWVWSTEVTKFHPNGNELENRDTLNRYSAEILGYADQMVVAVAANANYNQIAFDGFEDYNYEQNLSGNFQCPPPNHFGFDVMPHSREAHTGKYSLKVNAGQSEEADFQIHSCQEQEESTIDGYELRPCDCLGTFSPNKSGAYVLSTWIKEIHSDTIFNYEDANIEIKVGGLPTTFKATGEIIEGWQRIYGVFNIPGGSTDISVELNAAPFRDTYFDDIRLHPYNASFKSYVYDDANLRFTYELDENNYFTKYEYNSQSGMLERVKKETERGVMTIQESRFAQFKQTN